ncbi:hypothetical protein WA026_021566 [Henosepilachna vigintioctopunctata]|uniref:Glucose dehydrogenase [FAD, quinone]-like n=1 Tax=Henosepilachna vigintioctopunctata TaxID=420089 RepID=A0AAW1VAH9_9CUCU
MSWVPPDLSQSCQAGSNITTCQPSTFLFLQLVSNLFGQSKDAVERQDHHTDLEDFIFGDKFFENVAAGGANREDNAYDFIVVGAGSAGCVVANRLSEIRQWKVLLLEAGGDEPDVTGVPAFPPMLQGSSIDWGYTTEPQQYNCLRRREQRCNWPRGKVMGGSSAINYMIYLRGSPEDFNEWESMGNKGWSYDDVLPYFKKSEDNHDAEAQNTFFHGTEGYLSIERFPFQDTNVNMSIRAYQELGLKIVDQNTDEQIGVMLLQQTVKNGERQSTNTAFIRPIRQKRKNLKIETNTYVSRILINPDTKIAYGVEYFKNNKVFMVTARKEVILSAGTFNSPKTLMLSGIGPSSHLNEMNIKIIQDLQVGYNLQDHSTLDGVIIALNNTATSVSDEERERDIRQYIQNHNGPLSATGTLQIDALVQTRYENSLDRPDIQLLLDTTNVQNFINDPILTSETNVLPLAYYDGLMLRPVLLSPESRGVVKLNTSDPVFGPPRIFSNTFRERIDVLRIVEGIRQGLNLLKTQAYRSIGANLVTNKLPGCEPFIYGSDEYWECLMRSYTGTLHHQVGTCKMGPIDDKEAVVNPELKVHGIKNLRVIDASVMPKVVRGNTNAAVIMIAEKGSDMIKNDWLHHKN